MFSNATKLRWNQDNPEYMVSVSEPLDYQGIQNVYVCKNLEEAADSVKILNKMSTRIKKEINKFTWILKNLNNDWTWTFSICTTCWQVGPTNQILGKKKGYKYVSFPGLA